jgi:hypothetical protein
VSFRREYCFHFPRNFRWFPAISPECSGKCIGSDRFRPYLFDLGSLNCLHLIIKTMHMCLERGETLLSKRNRDRH